MLEQQLNDEEEHVFRLILLLDLNEEEAQEIYRQELEIANNGPGEEELGQIVMTLFEELEENRITVKLDERFGNKAALISEEQYLARREWAISELEKESLERADELRKRIESRMARKRRKHTSHYLEDSRIKYLFENNIENPWQD